MYIQQQHFFQLEISESEWKRVEFLLDVLEPFKKCNDRMEAMKRPGIEKVFWIYETLFNELDRLAELIDRSNGEEGDWVEELHPAFTAMRAKLTKYYTGTSKPSVYGDGMILDPRLKLYLTTQPEWSGGQDGPYSGAGYSAACRNRYIQQYEKSESHSQFTTASRKRPHSAMEDDDFEQMVNSLPLDMNINEYDAYIKAPRILQKGNGLDIWRIWAKTTYPHLATMVRDILAVPATGAGVERQFSKSGKVETKLRARIDPVTTCESMMYKDMLVRKNRALIITPANTSAEDIEMESNEEPPSEWRYDWFKGRKNKRIVM